MSPETTEAIRSASAPSWLAEKISTVEPDVGVRDLVRDHLGAAAVLRLGLGVAVRELEGGDVTAAASSPPSSSSPQAAKRQGQRDDTGGERRTPPRAPGPVEQCHHRFLSPVVSRAGSLVAVSTATSSSKSRSIAARSAGQPGDELEGVGGLVDGHAGAAEHRAAASRAALEQRGLERAVDDVGDPQVRPQQLRRHGRAGVGGHPVRRGVDQAGARGHRLGEPVGGDRDELDLRRTATQGRRQRARPGVVGVDDQQPAHPERGERVGDGGAGTARAEEHDTVPVDARQAVDERPLEAGDVGVVPDGPAVADQDGVEGTDRRHLGRHLVDQRHHRLLGRVGDVEAVEAELDRAGQQPLQAVGVDRAVGLLDDLVDVAKPLPLRLPLVQLRGQRRTDAVADQPGQPGPSWSPRRHRPSLSGR